MVKDAKNETKQKNIFFKNDIKVILSLKIESQRIKRPKNYEESKFQPTWAILCHKNLKKNQFFWTQFCA